MEINMMAGMFVMAMVVINSLSLTPEQARKAILTQARKAGKFAPADLVE